MRLSRVYSRACAGVEAPLITVEVHLGGGLPKMSIVGLPETAVKESRDRVKAALVNSGFDLPLSRATISLAPAELPKVGGGFDLPIALGILTASKQVSPDLLEDCEFLGELSLGGGLRSVRGVLPAAIRAAEAGRRLIVPAANEEEASLPQMGERLCASSLLEVTSWLNGRKNLPSATAKRQSDLRQGPDLADVVGQQRARRALEVAAGGGHNLLMVGPPGTGKTMLATRLPGIMPPMTESEALESAAVASISVQGLDIRNWRRRPFRAPHHTSSAVALVGGGSQPRPGEISLAHHGVLFLDELPEYGRHVLEVLREPMESGRIIISRAARQAEFPASFQLVAAMNPCPCGFAGDPGGKCRCSAERIERYRDRVSGPMLDRIDLQVEVPRPAISISEFQGAGGEPSTPVRARVAAARQLQLDRCATPNARLNPEHMRLYCKLGQEQRQLLDSAADHLGFSPRACHRILKVARTIADLGNHKDIEQADLAEAIGFRRLAARSAGP